MDVRPLLAVSDVSVNFGGVRALKDVSVEAPPRAITGLIGPNGAGKTTLFNVVTGLIRPTTGTVTFDGVDITGRSTHRRARLGIARTFQRLELFSRLSVYDNLLVAAESGGESLVKRILPPKGARRTADDVLESMGLASVRDQMAGALPTGTARILEVARALCARPRLLLLDEPSAGLDERETLSLARALRTVLEATDVAVLLVEHDVEFVLSLSHEIFVLDFGQLIARGAPEEIRRDESVQAAYLGEPEPEASREPLPPSTGNGIGPSAAVAKPPERQRMVGREGALLSVEHLEASYGRVRVLQDVTLSVEKGTVVALLGPNGAGKSTTLRTIAGSLKPTGGEVRLGGEVISGLPPHAIARRGVALIPEERAIYAGLTVRDNLVLFADPGRRRHGAALVERAVATFPVLGSRLDQRAGTLSGGEQRMLAMARALSPDLRLLVLDEISLGLAPLVVGQLFEEIATLASTGITVLLVEQYVHAALKLCDYVYLLAKGRIVHEGTPHELDEQVLSTYVGA